MANRNMAMFLFSTPDVPGDQPFASCPTKNKKLTNSPTQVHQGGTKISQNSSSIDSEPPGGADETIQR